MRTLLLVTVLLLAVGVWQGNSQSTPVTTTDAGATTDGVTDVQPSTSRTTAADPTTLGEGTTSAPGATTAPPVGGTTSAPAATTAPGDVGTTAPPPVVTTAAPAQPTTRRQTQKPGTTLLPDPTPLPDLIEQGGVQAELGTPHDEWDKTAFRTVMATSANIWCTTPENCEPADPVIVSAKDVVVYQEEPCSSAADYQCEGEANMVVGFYIVKPGQSHEVLMTSDSLTNMLIEHDQDLEEQLGYSVTLPAVAEEDTYPYALQPWAITLILFGIVCLIVLLVIVWVWYRRKKRLEKMPANEMEQIMQQNGYSKHSTVGKKDEGTLVYQAWITKAMKEGDVGTQVRKDEILREMSEVEDSGVQRSDVIVARVRHEDETKPPAAAESPIVTRASIEPSPPTSPQDVQAEMPTEPPKYESIADASDLPPPPETLITETPAAEAEEPLPAPPTGEETEALNELEKLIDEGGKSPQDGVDNAGFDSTAAELPDDTMTTSL